MNTFFDRHPAWRELADQPLEARLAALDDDERRTVLIDAAREHQRLDWAGVFVIATEPANYRFTPADSLASHAARRGVDAVQAFVDISRETRGAALFSYPFLNQNHDAIVWMLGKDYCVLGLADSGAHVGQIMDAGQPTWLLAHWVRDAGLMTLEDGVRRLTSEPADLFSVVGRGRIAPGQFADINVLDLESLSLKLPTIMHDFPLGAARYVQHATGYEATIVNGQVFMEKGEHAGALAGVTLRS
jgi:N-acyl-D-aspartate/D-glutamate deacylase